MAEEIGEITGPRPVGMRTASAVREMLIVGQICDDARFVSGHLKDVTMASLEEFLRAWKGTGDG